MPDRTGRKVFRFDLQSAKLTNTIDIAYSSYGVAEKRGTLVVVGDSANTVSVYKADGTAVTEFSMGSDQTISLAMHPAGTQFAVGFGNGWLD